MRDSILNVIKKVLYTTSDCSQTLEDMSKPCQNCYIQVVVMQPHHDGDYRVQTTVIHKISRKKTDDKSLNLNQNKLNF